MLNPAQRKVKLYGFLFLLTASLFPAQIRAQSMWDKIKQAAKEQACKGGDQKACQDLAKTGQQPQSQQPGQPAPTGQQPSQQQGGSQPANAPANTSGQPATAGNPAPAAAGGGNAEPWSPDSGSATGANATAGSAANFASSGPPDFSKLPDIGGAVRVGLTHDEMQAAELKIHPGFQVITNNPSFNTLVGLSRDNKPPFQGLRGFFGTTDGKHDDTFFAWYTMPPAKQQVYSVSRTFDYPEPGIDRLKLIAALRQKYGPETKATHDWDKTKEGTGDEKITAMYWAYDEQGHFIASDKGVSAWGNPPFGCPMWGNGYNPSNLWGDTANQYRLNTLPPASFCDTIVLLSVNLGCEFGAQFCRKTITEIDDHVLLRRTAQLAAEAVKADAQKRQQQQLDQSRQAKPTL
jgi:hypothetical protein